MSDLIKSKLGYEYDLKDALRHNPTITTEGDEILAVALARIEALKAELQAAVAAAYEDAARLVETFGIPRDEFDFHNGNPRPSLAKAIRARAGADPLAEHGAQVRTMSDNVFSLGNVTRLDLPTERVLDAAKGSCTEGVVVLGFDDDGDFYFASSIADGGSVIWLLEQAKLALLQGENTDD